MTVLFLGSRPQSLRCLRYLLDKISRAEVVGLIPNTLPTGPNQAFKKFCLRRKISMIPLEKARSMNFDLGISVLFDKKVPADILKIASRGFVNAHLAPLPCFRLANGVFHAILRAREENRWEFGVTLHYMNEALDAGPIIDEIHFPIFEEDTAFSLYTRANEKLVELFTRNAGRLVKSKVRLPARKQVGKANTFRRGGIDHEVDLAWSSEKIYDTVRALTFPGKSKPYVKIGKHRFYLSLEE